MMYFMLDVQDDRNVWVLHRLMIAPNVRVVLDHPYWGTLLNNPKVRIRRVEPIVAETTIPDDTPISVVTIDTTGTIVSEQSYRQFLHNLNDQDDPAF